MFLNMCKFSFKNHLLFVFFHLASVNSCEQLFQATLILLDPFILAM